MIFYSRNLRHISKWKRQLITTFHLQDSTLRVRRRGGRTQGAPRWLAHLTVAQEYP